MGSANFWPVRIVIVGQQRPDELWTWSGIPANLGKAISELGMEVDYLSADPPRPLLRAAVLAVRAAGVRQPGASHGPELAALRTRVLAHRVRGHEDAHFVLADSGFDVPPGLRYLTFQDMTVAQAIRVGWSDPALMGARPAAAWRARDERLARSALACCAASDWAAGSFVSDYGLAPERVHTVGFGINLPVKKIERDWSHPRYLFVGKEWERKNGAAVVSAFQRVRERLPDATLTLVGQHPPVSQPGVEDMGWLDLASAGDQKRLVGLLQASTCFVMPSKMEPFGIAYLEAGATGLPSIGTRVGGSATALGAPGVLVSPDDESELVEAMLRLADPHTARRTGAAAAEHASEFTWKRVAERLIGALEQKPAPPRSSPQLEPR